ncbi:uncharacterized protein [Euphorbia lathyris]|uniref:uncharacterized protein n=1 Tax=Euphorbia lathyris TaxID=212925 RepID=UPI00331398CF
MVGLQKGNSNGNRTGNKPYGLMLLLAFGAALLGVMTIHKLRERRIFNLLVKEKDHQLISLQLLLQKEREYTKEMKKKAEEMKTKIYSLRNQNMETDRRILELQSTIHSLKDERKILESALDEKRTEIKANQKKIIRKENNPQVTALMERLKQKEAEIEDLKRHLESSVRRSSNGKPNFNLTGNSVGNETRVSQSKVETGELYDSTNNSNGVNPLERGNTSTVESENAGRFENRSESKGGLRVNGENNTANAAEKLVNTGDTDSGMRSAHGQENTVARDEQMGLKNSEQDEGQGTLRRSAYSQENKVARDERMGVKNSEQDEGQGTLRRSAYSQENKVARDEQMGLKTSEQDEDQGALKGGQKLEMANKSRTSNGRTKSKYAKETRWRKLARNRRLVNSRNDENDEHEGIGKRKIPVDNKNHQSDEEEATKLEDLSNAKLLKFRKPDYLKDAKNVPVIEDTVQHLEKLQANGSLDDEATGNRSNATKESSDSNSDSELDQENYGRGMKMQDKAAQANDVKDEMQEADNETVKVTAEFDRELVPDDLEENKEDYKEETEESEF